MMKSLDLQHYLTFLQTRRQDIRRIAQHSQGESQLEDVQGEIWLMADELSKKYGCPIDFSNFEDQSLLIAHTYQKLVRYCETQVRYAVRLDDSDREGRQPNNGDRLTYGETETPVDQLVSQVEVTLDTSKCHSLGGAWVAMLDNCSNRMTSVAYFLKISLGHSYRCFNKVMDTVRWQYSLPLYLPDNAPLDLRPWRTYRYYRKPEQLVFSFDEELPL